MADQSDREAPSEGQPATTLDPLKWHLVHDAPIGIAIKTPDGRYTWANEAATRLLGVPLSRLLEATDASVLPASLAARLSIGERRVLSEHRAVSDRIEPGPDGLPLDGLILRFPLGDANTGTAAIGVFIIEHSTGTQEFMALRETLHKLERTNAALRDALDELDHLASTDKLTAAWNRRRLEEAVQDEMHRLERYGHPVAALFLDIDHFKAINDAYGHAVGDSVLVALTKLLRGSFRRSDSVSRWGGEEFIVLCPATSLSMATLLAERLRKSIALADFPLVHRVTVSIGVAECLAGESWDQWLGRADAALLRAKQMGRNQVSVAPETMNIEREMNPVAGRFLQLSWRKAYTSGHALIDLQHQMLFDQSNALLSAVLGSQSAPEVEAAFQALIDGVANHFRDEEAILNRIGFPGLDAHRGVHRELCASVFALLEKFRSGSLGVGELFEFLARDVIAKHLLGADREFFPYLACSELVPSTPDTAEG